MERKRRFPCSSTSIGVSLAACLSLVGIALGQVPPASVPTASQFFQSSQPAGISTAPPSLQLNTSVTPLPQPFAPTPLPTHAFADALPQTLPLQALPYEALAEQTLFEQTLFEQPQSPVALASLPALPGPQVPSTPEAAAEPTYPTVRLTGFFHADAVWFDQQDANRAAIVDGRPIGDIQDGADFRRARLAAVGKAWDNVNYMLEMDFGFPGRPSFMDVWLEVEDVVGEAEARVGLFRQPIGFDGMQSARELTFIERSLPFIFLPFRQIGVMTYGTGFEEQSTWAVSAFRFPSDVYGGNIGDNGGYGLSSRVTGLLIDRGPGNGLLHIGGAYSFIDPANDAVQYRNQPEIFVTEVGGGVPIDVPNTVPAFVDTGPLVTNNVQLFGGELAAAYGSFHTQSELLFARIDRLNGNDVFLPGGYVQAAYFLTGERTVYNRQGGVFGRVTPLKSVGRQGGIGAWEVAGRWSHLDFNDSDVAGGRLNNLTAGLNWYLNPRTKFQANFIHAMLDNPTTGESETDIYGLRAQVDF